MSGLIDCSTIMDFTNAATSHSVVLDLSDCDILSIGINVTAATGSNILSLGESVDGTNFAEIATLTITGSGLTIWHVYPVFSQYEKILYTPGSGSATFKVQLNTRVLTVKTAGIGVKKIIGTN